MTDNLGRFHRAQDKSSDGYEQAFHELKKGRKTSHWIWYIFPQLFELGFSATAKQYGIADVDEACDYLRDPVLFDRYHAMVTLVEQQLASIPIKTLMGSDLDSQKLMSSLTLFRAAAAYLYSQQPNFKLKGIETSCNAIFSSVEKVGYQPCQKTLDHIKKQAIKTNDSGKLASPVGVAMPDAIVDEPSVSPASQSDFTASTFPGFFGGSAVTSQSDSTQPKPLDVVIPNAAPDEPTQPSPPILPVLNNYIHERSHEWGFHYNFLGMMSVLYFIKDKILGTDHFNSKNRDIKISAATKLSHLVQQPGTCEETFSKAEKEALQEGRLGKIVAIHGGLEQLLLKPKITLPKDNVSRSSIKGF